MEEKNLADKHARIRTFKALALVMIAVSSVEIIAMSLGRLSGIPGGAGWYVLYAILISALNAPLIYRLVGVSKEGQKLTAILEETTDFVAVSDVNGNLRYINNAGLAMLGQKDGQARPLTHLTDIYPEIARAFIMNDVIPNALRNGSWTGETTFLTVDGEGVPVSQVITVHRKTPSGDVEFISTIARDISDRKQTESQLKYVADHDPLTGLYNRRGFLHELSRSLEHALKIGQEGAVLFLDLDNFKLINDTMGHKAGDDLLKTVAGVLEGRLRRTDILARLGGDEFAVLIPQGDSSQAAGAAQQILEAIRENRVLINGRPVEITTSIGVALFPDHGMTPDEILVRADMAMYKAKEAGRNRYHFYICGDQRQGETQSNLVWSERIRKALEGEGFVLHLQPVMNLHNKSITQYEVLVRMIGDEGEILMPADFIGIAERFGFIGEIDRWVIRKAIRLISEKRKEGSRLSLEVNLSPRILGDSEILHLIEEEIRCTGIDPSDLLLEVSETSAIANILEAQGFMARIKALGCRFVFDDFGVGFSSFNYLKNLPVDFLKIDGAFIRELRRSQVDRHLVKAIVEVARGLGKETIAEFVDDIETIEILKQLGVDYAQGYAIGRPHDARSVLFGQGIRHSS